MILSQSASCCAGLFFLFSAWSKLRDFGSFARIAGEYPFPAKVSPLLAARLIPAIEVALALGLLGWPAWSVRVPAFGAVAFLTCVSSAVAVRLARGERTFACGCVGDLDRPHSARWILARNGALILLLAGSGWSSGRNLAANPLPVYLAGVGFLLSTQLVGAAHTALGLVKEWTVTG